MSQHVLFIFLNWSTILNYSKNISSLWLFRCLFSCLLSMTARQHHESTGTNSLNFYFLIRPKLLMSSPAGGHTISLIFWPSFSYGINIPIFCTCYVIYAFTNACKLHWWFGTVLRFLFWKTLPMCTLWNITYWWCKNF